MKSSTCYRKDGVPRSEFYSESDAWDAAEHEAQMRGMELVPYRCNKCEKWHLSPAERVTPSKPCTYGCLDASGRKKESYATESAAQSRAQLIFEERSISLSVYESPGGSGWHLTKS